MFSMTATVCIEAPVAEVWVRLARIEEIALWVPVIRSATVTPGHESGSGAERVCLLAGGIEITEQWTDWTEGKSFTYEGTGMPGVTSARNTWSVEPVRDHTLLTSESAVEAAGPIGRLLEPLMKRQARRLARQTMGNFKWLVETGEAPPVKGPLLPAPVTC